MTLTDADAASKPEASVAAKYDPYDEREEADAEQEQLEKHVEQEPPEEVEHTRTQLEKIVDADDTHDDAPNDDNDKVASSSSPSALVPAKKQSFMEAAMSERLRPFVIISCSYLLFTITDGAIRMIVLLHAYNKNFSALQVAIMFTLYEVAGVFTNLAAGVMGAKWGIKLTLVSGLLLQLLSYGLLFGWKDEWDTTTSIMYVTIAQMFAGIAKDLTKLGGKTVTKLVTPDEKETQLFKLVSLLTGWKNSLKGVGYFLGSALIQVSYELALFSMMGLVVLALPWAIMGLDKNLGMAKKENSTWRDIFCMDNPNLNVLSLARMFLFASRDFWFEVPLPFFLRSPSCEGLGIDSCLIDNDCGTGAICGVESMLCENVNTGGGCGGLSLNRVAVGAFLGGYIILYGQVQSWTPQLVTGPLKQTPPNKLTEVMWGMINCLPTAVAAIVMQFSAPFDNRDTTVMLPFLLAIIITFAVIFAINSSIHSFLVVNYASKEKVAVSVGFYYMSNALGRLFGTIGSGLIYTYVGDEVNAYSGNDAVTGLAACFLAGTVSSLIAALITTRIDDHKAGLQCGSCWTVVAPEAIEEDVDNIDGADDTDHGNNTAEGARTEI
jgi:hypothetical protein